jgi:hypothetical protein
MKLKNVYNIIISTILFDWAYIGLLLKCDIDKLEYAPNYFLYELQFDNGASIIYRNNNMLFLFSRLNIWLPLMDQTISYKNRRPSMLASIKLLYRVLTKNVIENDDNKSVARFRNFNI